MAVLADAAVMTEFVPGPGQDLTDVNFQAEMADIVFGCVYDPDADPPAVVIGVAPIIVATRGPANQDRQARIRYFVSLIARDRTIVNKSDFEVGVGFPENRSRVVLREDDPPVSIDIPLGNPQDATSYEVLVGFQLSPDQLELNRRRRSAGRSPSGPN